MALDFVAGCIGGCAGVLVGHPFDTVKVRLQTQSTANPLYRGTYDCFACIIRKESVFGLYKGLASPLYGLAAINAIVFGVQGNIQRRMNNPDTLQAHFIAGSIAGTAQCIICSPMELAKTRMQIQGQGESLSAFKKHKHEYKGPVDCLKKIYKVEGVKGLCRGMGLTVIRETPSFGVYFAAYEYFVRSIQRDEGDASAGVLLVSGGLAGMASWMSTYPVDVIKSRVQADSKGEYKGMMDCAVKSYQREGVMVFTRGLGSTLLRAFPTNAATLATVTLTLRWLRISNDDVAFDMAQYQATHNPPQAARDLPVLANFPSHP